MTEMNNSISSAQLLNIARIEPDAVSVESEVSLHPATAMAPLALTLTSPLHNADDPGCVETAHSVRQRALEGPSNNAATTSPSRAEFAQARLDAAGKSVIAAREVGVDLNKAAFVKSCCNVALKAVVVGIAAALTVASVGGAAPLLGLASASMAVSACDAVCAYRNFKNADAQSHGQPKPYADLRYNNSVMNLAHSLSTALGVSDATSGTVAKCAAVVVGGGLAMATFAMSLGMSGVPDTLALVEDCTSAVRAAYYVVAAASETYAASGNVDTVRGRLGEAEIALGGIMQDDQFNDLQDPMSDPAFAAAHEQLLALMNNDAESGTERGISLQGTTGKAIAGICMSLGLLSIVPEVGEFGANLMQSSLDLLQV